MCIYNECLSFYFFMVMDGYFSFEVFKFAIGFMNSLESFFLIHLTFIILKNIFILIKLISK